MRALRSIPAVLVLTLALVVAVSAQTSTQTPKKPLDVPYVPTDEKIVATMLDVAKVRKTDLLIDLGSGDGRIPITAAKKYGAKGIGYDIDPQRIAEARENAQKAGVSDRVKFVEGDIFDAEIKEASVVTLYLLPDVNLKLRPKLLSELKPGTRIVSHNYDMGDWKPEKSIKVELPSGPHMVYFWTVPARKTGASR